MESVGGERVVPGIAFHETEPPLGVLKPEDKVRQDYTGLS